MRCKKKAFEVVHHKQLILSPWLNWALVMPISHDRFTSKDWTCPTQSAYGYMIDRHMLCFNMRGHGNTGSMHADGGVTP